MAENPQSVQELESPRHLNEQRREWVFERAGWVFVSVTILAALLGLLGPGPLSYRQRASADGSLSVEYSLLERYEAPAELKIHFSPAAAQDGQTRLSLSREFTDQTSRGDIVPRPLSVEAVGDRVVYTFQMSGLDRDGVIVYRYQSNDFGSLQFDIGIEGREPVHLRQFVFP